MWRLPMVGTKAMVSLACLKPVTSSLIPVMSLAIFMIFIFQFRRQRLSEICWGKCEAWSFTLAGRILKIKNLTCLLQAL